MIQAIPLTPDGVVTFCQINEQPYAVLLSDLTSGREGDFWSKTFQRNSRRGYSARRIYESIGPGDGIRRRATVVTIRKCGHS
jgi:hypothetical protein